MGKARQKGFAANRQRLNRKHRTPPGAAPGTLIPDPEAEAPRIRVMAYGPDTLDESVIDDVQALQNLIDTVPMLWVNVDGLGDLELIRSLGLLFGLHELALEDVVNVYQRPKVEDYDDHLFIVVRMPHGGEQVDTEQVALVLGPGYVLTFQEHVGDCFDPVRERLRKSPNGRIRGSGSDYLGYALIDAVIDSFFPVLEACGERLGDLEQKVLDQPSPGVVQDIYALKRDLLALRRAVWPLRDMANALIRDESRLISDRTRLFLRDCYDHCVQLMDMLESYREVASGLIDIHLSSVTAHTNEAMKFLTLIATIFIPLSFVAGIYGMNFDPEASPWNMPELDWYLGYPFALGLMLLVAAGFLIAFYRKGWLGGRRPPR